MEGSLFDDFILLLRYILFKKSCKWLHYWTSKLFSVEQ